VLFFMPADAIIPAACYVAKTKVEKCECAKTVGEKMGGRTALFLFSAPYIVIHGRDLYTDAPAIRK